MKKLLAGLLLVGSVLSFGAQRMQVEKMVMNGDLFYVQGEQKPYSGEIEKKYPSGKTLGLATIKAGKLEGKVYEYYEKFSYVKTFLYDIINLISYLYR